MKYIFFRITNLVIVLFFIVKANAGTSVIVHDSIPQYILGNFVDDYGIRYTVTDSIWTQHPGTKYHILHWNLQDQYIIARNGASNPSDTGLYTRIDYMKFENMAPWYWGFCLTIYKAKSVTEAELAVAADRQNPKKGCNGYPFSRMKKTD